MKDKIEQAIDKVLEKESKKFPVVDVELGDIVLMGRFKNKKVKVKKIGKDKHGDPTINNRPSLKFRTVEHAIDIVLGEAVQSSILREIINAAKKTDPDANILDFLSKKYDGIAWSEVQDINFMLVDPKKVKREKNNKLMFWLTLIDKSDPNRLNLTIKEGTLLGVSEGSLLVKDNHSKGFLGYAGLHKSIKTVKKLAELADVVYSVDLDVLTRKYGTKELITKRQTLKKGATALLSDTEFRKLNQDRYEEIITARYDPGKMNALMKEIVDISNEKYTEELAKIKVSKEFTKIRYDGWGKLVPRVIKDITNEAWSAYETYIRYAKEFEEAKEQYAGNLDDLKMVNSSYPRFMEDYILKIRKCLRELKSL